jgi:asparagine synthase (glutamine-hydrolysing)
VIASTVARTPGVASLDTFTVGVDIPGAISEFAWARHVADSIGAKHHELRLREDEHTALLREVAEHIDQPLAEPVCAQLYGVCRLARAAGIKVLLSGEGADEIFSGYRVYPNMELIGRAQRLIPGPLLRGVVAPAFGRASGALGRFAKIAKLLSIAGEPLPRRYLGVNFFESALKARLYRGDVAEALRGHDVLATVARHYDGAGGPEALGQMAAFDCRAWLPDNILLRSDLMSMAASLEMRVPFLDHRLVELAQRIPARHKLTGRTGKVVMRRAFADRVPKAVLARPKIGFATPLRELFRLDFGREAEELLTGPGATTEAFFNRAAVRQCFADHRGGRENSRTLHQLYALESWGRALARRELPTAPPPR